MKVNIGDRVQIENHEQIPIFNGERGTVEGFTGPFINVRLDREWWFQKKAPLWVKPENLRHLLPTEIQP